MILSPIFLLAFAPQNAPEPRLALPSSGHASRITALATSPDRKWIASADFEGFLLVRDANSGREHFAADLVRTPKTNLSELAWSADSSAVCGVGEQTLTIVETRTMTVFARFPLPGANDATDDVEPDGFLAAGVHEGRWWLARVRPADVESDELIGGSSDSGVTAVSELTRNGTRACLGFSDGSAVLVDLREARVLAHFGANESVRGFLADGRLFSFSADTKDKRVHHIAWRDGQNGTELGSRSYVAASEFVRPVIWWHASAEFALPIVDMGLRTFHGEDLSAATPLPKDIDALVGAPGRKSGEWVVSLGTPAGVHRFELGFYDERKQAIVERWECGMQPVRSLRADGNGMLIGGASPARLSWSDAGLAVKSLPSQPQLYASLPGGAAIFARAEPSEVQFLRADGSLDSRVPLGEGQFPQEMIVDANARRAAVRTWNKLHVLDIASKNVLWSSELGGGSLTFTAPGAVAFSPDGERVAACAYRTHTDSSNVVSVRSELAAFSAVDGKALWRQPAHMGHMRYLPDGSQIGGVYEQGTQYISVDSNTGEPRWQSFFNRFQDGYRAAWRSDGALIALAPSDTIFLTRISDRICERQVPIPPWTYTSLAYGPGDRHLWFGCDDGRVHVMDESNGKVLATLAMLPDGEWVVTTPDGRFDATTGAREQLYYVRGPEALPLEACSEAFFTPRLLSRVFAGEVLPAPKVELAKLERPPTVELQRTASQGADDEIELVLRSRGPRAPAELRLFHNGKRVLLENKPTRDAASDQTAEVSFTLRHKLALVPGSNRFRLIALNSQRTESAPAHLEVDHQSANEVRPRLFVLACGVNAYANPKYNLNYARADAEAFAGAWSSHSAALFAANDAQLLLDADVTRASLAAAFERIAVAAAPSDVFVFYYAGHGAIDGRGDFHLAPHDVTQLYGDDSGLAEKGVATKDLLAWSQAVRAQKQLFVLDACQSGGALEGLARRGAAEEKAIAQLARATGTHWLVASGAEQFAAEFKTLGHGLFTYALLEAFSGRASGVGGQLTVLGLSSYLETRVPELALEHRGAQQYPASYGSGHDFPIAIQTR